MSDNIFSDLFYMVHKNGRHLYPYKLKNRQTGKVAFQVSVGGAGGNTKQAGEEIDCEERVKDLVVNHGYAVRVKTKDNQSQGLYKAGQRSIVEVVVMD